LTGSDHRKVSRREPGHVLFTGPTRGTDEGGNEMLLAVADDPGEYIGDPFPAPGAEVHRRSDARGFLVVDHAWESVIVARWPMRVWRVTDVVPASREYQVTAWYTRATSVRIAEELEAWRVFGQRGWGVAAVIEQSAALDREDASALANGRPEEAGDAYRRGWAAWESASGDRSPVGHGLILVSQTVERAAMAIDPSLFKFDPVHEVDVLADRQWGQAKRACLEAALAFGAPELLTPADADVMSAGWRARFGTPNHPRD
jgi:hypothetical protein